MAAPTWLRMTATAAAVTTGLGIAGLTTSDASASRGASGATPIYLDTHYSFAARAADLVSRMTLPEKVAQLSTNNGPAIPRLGVQQHTTAHCTSSPRPSAEEGHHENQSLVRAGRCHRGGRVRPGRPRGHPAPRR